MVDDETLDQLAHGDDAFPAAANVDDRVDDGVVIGSFIDAVVFFGDQLFQNVGKIRRHGFADLGAGVFTGRALTDLNETVEGDAEPLILVLGYL